MGKQHTAGPWNVAGCEIFSADNDKMIARVFSGAESNVLLSGAISAHEADCNAALVASAPDLLQALEAGYIFALNHPHDAYRARNQETLCAMRDAICKATGRDSQDVQDDYESRALMARGSVARGK